MAKDLTVSRIDRQNILNNDLAIQEIQSKSGIEGILWDDKLYVTREDVANYFDVDIRTISRYIEQNNEELTQNGYEVLKGKRLKSFLETSKGKFAKDIILLLCKKIITVASLLMRLKNVLKRIDISMPISQI